VLAISRRACAAGSACLALWLVAQTPAEARTLLANETYQVDLSMHVQEKDQWCWAAAGNTIAAFHGVVVSQTRFCQLAHDESGQDCRDKPGSLADVQHAFSQLGFSSPGDYVESRIGFNGLRAQIAAGKPVETRIAWKGGGGHVHVVYGYDTEGSRVLWGDPWSSYPRYNSSAYDFYSANKSFTWTHTLVGSTR
jgi:hypothetical protein